MSLRQTLANRANGARSRGPITPEGIARSSQNAIRHGLLAKCVVLENESAECYEELLSDYIARFQPAGIVELSLIEEMASCNWRMRRAWAIETRTLDEAMANHSEGDQIGRIAAAFADAAARPGLPLMHRYETRFHMMNQHALHNLLLLRAAEMQNDPSPISGHSGLESASDSAPELPPAA